MVESHGSETHSGTPHREPTHGPGGGPSPDQPHDHSAHGFAHPVKKRLLYGVFITLVFLTWLTVAVAELPLGRLDVWVAMAIASVKAFLVMAFFMHMWWEKGFNVLVFASSLLFALLFVGLTWMDSDQYQYDIKSFPISDRPAPPGSP